MSNGVSARTSWMEIQRCISKARRWHGFSVHQCLTRGSCFRSDATAKAVRSSQTRGRIVYATSRGTGPHMTLAFAISQSISDGNDLLSALILNFASFSARSGGFQLTIQLMYWWLSRSRVRVNQCSLKSTLKDASDLFLVVGTTAVAD